MVRMAEVDRDTKLPSQDGMILKQDVIVGSHGFPFRVPPPNALACSADCSYGWLENLLQERYPKLAINQHEKNTCPTLTRNNEISFTMPDLASGIDFAWPLI